MGRKPETARADHEAVDPPDHVTEELRADLLLEQKRSLEQLNTWFEIALNNMVRGLSMFDREQRLIVCNSSYRQIYSLPEELTRPGTPLTEIVRYHLRHESGREQSGNEANFSKWLDERPRSHLCDQA